MLVLFDIDGTMLASEGVGVRSIEEVGQVLFGKKFSLKDIPVGGRLDPLIWIDLCSKYGIANAQSRHAEFKKTYIELLAKNIQQVKVEVLPGVRELLNLCSEQENIKLGIVTGNYKETGQLKLEAGKIDIALFETSAWGLDGQSRADLPAHAMQGYPGTTVLIGDTIHDVMSGAANGCKTIAVCTGSHNRSTLEAGNPDLLLEDLSDTEETFKWIMQFHNQSV